MNKKILNVLYYFPNGKSLLALSSVLLPILIITLLEYYNVVIEIVFIAIMLLIPFGLVLLLVAFTTKLRIKIYLWVLYVGVMLLLTLIGEGILFNTQMHDSIQRSTALINALEQYKKNTGLYPKELDALKGKYLEQIPNTAIGIFSTQEYYYSSDTGKFELVIYDHFLNLGGVHLYNSDYPERGWYYDD